MNGKTVKVPAVRRIGITGGVGAGKSEILRYLQESHHAAVLRTDETAQELMKPGGVCYERVKALFPDCVREDGCFDRKKMAGRVFTDPDLLETLNGVVHPAVWEAVMDWEKKKYEEGFTVLCIESALLASEKDNEAFEELWYIYAHQEVRRRRLKESRGYSDEKIDAMISSQSSEEAFEKNCDVRIDNSGEFEQTKQQIDAELL
ncbi:MAG: dephospho-CoA kinase [Eubacterium sp.]|nr:dephospho-CoA kinase [Eubacterium sp.]